MSRELLCSDYFSIFSNVLRKLKENKWLISRGSLLNYIVLLLRRNVRDKQVRVKKGRDISTNFLRVNKNNLFSGNIRKSIFIRWISRGSKFFFLVINGRREALSYSYECESYYEMIHLRKTTLKASASNLFWLQS